MNPHVNPALRDADGPTVHFCAPSIPPAGYRREADECAATFAGKRREIEARKPVAFPTEVVLPETDKENAS